jgi:hypothetical protein
VTAVHTEPLVPVNLIDRAARIEDAAVIVTQLPVRLRPGNATYVPAWLVRSRIVDSTGSVRQYEEYDGRRVSISNGSVTWEFAMPVGSEGGTAQSLEMDMLLDASMGGMAPGPPGTGSSHTLTTSPSIAVEALNPSTGQWVGLAGSGGSRMTVPPECMAADGTVRVRVSTGGNVTLMGVTMNGSVDARG